jgi:hypothetical protein
MEYTEGTDPDRFLPSWTSLKFAASCFSRCRIEPRRGRRAVALFRMSVIEARELPSQTASGRAMMLFFLLLTGEETATSVPVVM